MKSNKSLQHCVNCLREIEMKRMQVNGFIVEYCEMSSMWHVYLDDTHSEYFEFLDEARNWCLEH